jgi:type I restriction enzyme, S subunit
MTKEVSLSECCKIINGSTPSRIVPEYWGGEIHWFTPKDLSGIVGKYVDEAPEKITEAGFKSCSTTMVPAFSLLLTSRAPIGHIAINKREVCTNQGFKSLVPNDDVDVNYLYFVIKKMVPMLQDMGNGATFKELSKATISKVKIPLPPLPVQQKIAAILDAADLHRQKTKTLIEKYDQLTQSIFLEMFGDPVKNEKGWEKVELSKLGAVVTGSTPPSSKEGMFGGEIPFVTPGDLGKNSSIKRTVTTEGAKHSRIVGKGSLLVCCIGATIGKTDIARADSAFNQQINAVDWNESIVPLYGFHSFGFLKSEVISRGISTTLPILKKSEFAKIKVAVPPLHLQKIFAQRVKLIEDQATKISSTILKSEELFNTLLQRAFKGELVS